MFELRGRLRSASSPPERVSWDGQAGRRPIPEPLRAARDAGPRPLIAHAENADAVARGATGKGNDQVRFFTGDTFNHQAGAAFAYVWSLPLTRP
ncbi:argininosuccinate synthase domain-containing protein [Streptomyces sp. NPDC052069]|uniref:argininosuccinate synthase domain-containing protein n=1 Tax=Streptomyces sp. NPDC052069 TaxID=3154650 RepID=UPI003432EF7F